MMFNNASATPSSYIPLNPHQPVDSFHLSIQQHNPPTVAKNNPRKKRTKLLKINHLDVDDNSSRFHHVPIPPLAHTTTTSSNKPKGNTSTYAKKPDPTAPKITRPCTECGKRFWSLKALFGHMRCHPERQWRGINPPPNFRRSHDDSPNLRAVSDVNNDLTEEDHHVATCLLMLADVVPPPIAVTSHLTSTNTVGYQGFSDCLDTVVARDHHYDYDHVAATLGCQVDVVNNGHMDGNGAGPSGLKCSRFECSSCKKVFGSHQALGGHRASHKNVKGCFAITRNDGDEEHSVGDQGDQVINIKDRGYYNVDEVDHHNKMSAVMVFGHQCSICLRVFSSGQALGGHKRCHWEKGDDPSSLTHGGPNQFGTKEEAASALELNLNLNWPALVEDDRSSSSFTSGPSLDLRLSL